MLSSKRYVAVSFTCIALLTACNRNESGDDTAANIQEALTAADKQMPLTLRETNLFVDGNPLTPVSTLTPYEVKVALWSDGARKRRFVFVPPGETVSYDAATRAYKFPVGTTFVKHFASDTDPETPIETRVITMKSDGQLHFATYVYNDQGETEFNKRPRKVTVGGLEYRIPSEQECKTCHGNGAKILGFTTRQLGFAINDKNQLDKLAETIKFEGAPATSEVRPHDHPSDTTLPIMTRARTYIEVNCSPCHNPEGPEKANKLDFRIDSPDTHLVSEGKLIPGNLAESKIWQLISAEQDRMPPLVLRADPLALDVIRQMIEQWPK